MFANTIRYKPLVGISSNLGAVLDKDELIKFWAQTVRGQGHDEIKYGQKLLVQKRNSQFTIFLEKAARTQLSIVVYIVVVEMNII